MGSKMAHQLRLISIDSLNAYLQQGGVITIDQLTDPQMFEMLTNKNAASLLDSLSSVDALNSCLQYGTLPTVEELSNPQLRQIILEQTNGNEVETQNIITILNEYIHLYNSPLGSLSNIEGYAEKGITNLMVIADRGYYPLLEEKQQELTSSILKEKDIYGKTAIEYAKDTRIEKFLDTLMLNDALSEWYAQPITEEILVNNVIRFLQGDLYASIWHYGPLEIETAPLKDLLVEVNRSGFISTNGQPGVDEDVEGPDGVFHQQQKAFIDGLIRRDLFNKIKNPLLQKGYAIVVSDTNNIQTFGNPGEGWLTRDAPAGTDEYEDFSFIPKKSFWSDLVDSYKEHFDHNFYDDLQKNYLAVLIIYPYPGPARLEQDLIQALQK